LIDLYAYLDVAVLRRLWVLLWLPAQLLKSWEQKFPRPGRNQPCHRTRLNGLAAEPRHERIAKITSQPRHATGWNSLEGMPSPLTGSGTGRAAKLTYSPAGSGFSVSKARDNIGIIYSCIVHECWVD
jgi:hypothetical protein